MPTLAEMALLERSLGGLADTFQRNRALAATERERRARESLEREELGLRRDEFGLRREDQADARDVRKKGLESRMAHESRLEALQKEENADKRAKMGLDFLSELNKSGQLTDDGIAAMETKFGEMLGKAGLGVKLFRRAVPAEPTSRMTPGGREVTWMPGGKDLHVGETRPLVTEEEDPLTGEVKRKVSRRVDPSELDRAMRQQVAGGEEPEGEMDFEAVKRAIAGGDLQPVQGAPPGAVASPPAPTRVVPSVEAKTYPSEAEARAAGHKAGDVVRLVLNGKPTLVRLK